MFLKQLKTDKRTNYLKYGVQFPFYSPWARLIQSLTDLPEAKDSNEKSVAAIESLFPEEKGTIEFVSIILQWWNTVNVKSVGKGKRKRLQSACPITNDDSDENMHFLLKFVC